MTNIKQYGKDSRDVQSTDFVHSYDGDCLIITQELYDKRKEIKPYVRSIITLQKVELEAMLPTILDIVNRK